MRVRNASFLYCTGAQDCNVKYSNFPATLSASSFTPSAVAADAAVRSVHVAVFASFTCPRLVPGQPARHARKQHTQHGMKTFPTITAVRTYITQGVGAGGDYHNVQRGHWLIDNPISCVLLLSFPCINAECASKRPDVEIRRIPRVAHLLGATSSAPSASSSRRPTAPPAFRRALAARPPAGSSRRTSSASSSARIRATSPASAIRCSDQMFRATMFCGMKDPPVATISMVDLALWDLLGKLRGEPVYKMIGGAQAGLFGAKVPLPYVPDEDKACLRKNVAFLTKHRESVGPDFPIVHEYTKYSFRELIAHHQIPQPGVMWTGGLTELLKIATCAAAYDVLVVPHASGAYSYHFVVSQVNCPFQTAFALRRPGSFVGRLRSGAARCSGLLSGAFPGRLRASRLPIGCVRQRGASARNDEACALRACAALRDMRLPAVALLGGASRFLSLHSSHG
ncbi:hypothetical protein FB451DRAFT_1478804 [Mycena latifolia]|nr:hypothetical protein FB451DRAFT_1478804 [Mycena latifolia]